jgi:hypothetical protein
MSKGVLVSPGIDPGAVAMYGTVSCLSFISSVYYVRMYRFISCISAIIISI